MKRKDLIIGVLVLATAFVNAQTTAASKDKKTANPPAQANSASTAAAMEATDPAYKIGTEDVLAVNVWHETEMSRAVPVRPDGKISLPLAGEFQAAGLTPAQLEEAIRTKLQTLMQNPQVTVMVQEVRSQKFSIMGEVNRPGAYPLNGRMTVLEAIAAAGGLRDFAKTKKMYILRRTPDGATTRVKVDYKGMVEGKVDDPAMTLQARDTIVVP
jgi:polysaccharide export outer membrane protein